MIHSATCPPSKEKPSKEKPNSLKFFVGHAGARLYDVVNSTFLVLGIRRPSGVGHAWEGAGQPVMIPRTKRSPGRDTYIRVWAILKAQGPFSPQFASGRGANPSLRRGQGHLSMARAEWLLWNNLLPR